MDGRRQLHLQLPPDTPAGQAEVTVRVVSPAPASPAAAALRALLDELDTELRPRLPQQQVDPWINGQRAAWD